MLIPAALPSDSSDVADALDVARALFEKGQTEDAIRWVRNAIEAADQAGDAGRVATLARTVAELAERSRASVAPVPAPPPLPAKPSVVPTSVTPEPVVPPAPITPRVPVVAPSVPPAPATPRTPSVAPRVAKPSTIPQPPPTPRSLPPSASVVPKAPPAPPPVPALARAGRLRVSVRTSVRDPNLFVVRPLAEGASPPRGTRLAFLEMEAEEQEDVTDAIAEVESSR